MRFASIRFVMTASLAAVCSGVFAQSQPASRLAAPLPNPKESLQSYCARLERQAETVRFKCAWQIDWLDPSRPTTSRTIEFETSDFARVFAVARALHGIPASLSLPVQGPAQQTIADPKKPPYLWTSELAIKRSPSGQIESAQYSARGEGGGSGVRVMRKEGGTILIEDGAFGD